MTQLTLFFSLTEIIFIDLKLNAFDRVHIAQTYESDHWTFENCKLLSINVHTLGVSPRYQGIVKTTVSEVFEDLKFKISEGSDQNWSCPESQFSWDSQQGRVRTTSILVLIYSINCNLHNTLIPNLVKPLNCTPWTSL